MILGKSLNLSDTQFAHLKNGDVVGDGEILWRQSPCLENDPGPGSESQPVQASLWRGCLVTLALASAELGVGQV